LVLHAPAGLKMDACRKARASRAAPRTRDALWKTIGRTRDRRSPAACTTCLRHCG